MIERHNRLLEILAANQRIEVTTLADLLMVSQVTIRKDLDHLEARGLLRREHGFALFGSIDDVGKRLALHYEVKRRIAQEAAKLVEEGETVMIESGSCCTLLAEELTNTRRDVTIVTNSAFIANYTRHAPYGRVILLGGEYQPTAQVTVGAITRRSAEVFFSDKFFIGVDGFTPKYGFTGKDHLRAQTVRDLVEQAQQVIVLTESEKFSHQGAEGLIRTEEVEMVFTDDKIPATIAEHLKQRDIRLIAVKS
jgi:DeoR/GlpR family transcriptional regulator of sugar metabolism